VQALEILGASWIAGLAPRPVACYQAGFQEVTKLPLDSGSIYPFYLGNIVLL
jgi:hypothetical protein